MLTLRTFSISVISFLGIILPCPSLAWPLPILVSLALSCLFHIVGLVCPIFASILADVLLATVLIR